DADPARVLARAVALHAAPAGAPGRLRGTGVSLYVEDLHGAPVAAPARLTALERADGPLFALAAGTASNGQGHETSFRAIAARELGIAPGQLVFLQGDTAMLSEGAGTGGSWSLTIGGNAVLLAAQAAVEEGRRRAAVLLEAAEADIEFEAGRFRVAGTDRELDWAALVAGSPGLAVERRYDRDAETRPCGCHVAEVELDPETGAVALIRLTVVQDSGVLVDATLAAGQMVGGLAQGVGAALLERMVHDADAQLLSGSFLDYALPRAGDLPAMQPVFDATPAAANPLGVKGIGEAGTTGVSAAVANAVADALAKLGAPDVQMPATPAAVWQAIAAARSPGAA
uniref:xanthine dehydrogenase family protein molybdopterin-binding subunit n=1 Tax=Falsiroseomonas oryzae TaxID=2766473 RepID=UPI0022EAA805